MSDKIFDILRGKAVTGKTQMMKDFIQQAGKGLLPLDQSGSMSSDTQAADTRKAMDIFYEALKETKPAQNNQKDLAQSLIEITANIALPAPQGSMDALKKALEEMLPNKDILKRLKPIAFTPPDFNKMLEDAVRGGDLKWAKAILDARDRSAARAQSNAPAPEAEETAPVAAAKPFNVALPESTTARTFRIKIPGRGNGLAFAF